MRGREGEGEGDREDDRDRDCEDDRDRDCEVPGLDTTTYRLYDPAGELIVHGIIRRLMAAGWQLVRVKGDHHHFKHMSRPGIVTVPHPKKDLPIGTIRAIEKQSGVKLL